MLLVHLIIISITYFTAIYNIVSENIEKIYSQDKDTITYNNFVQIPTAKNAAYCQKYIWPRLFSAIDAKKTGAIDFEDFLRAVALFRLGTVDDQIKLLYIMYDGSKSGGNLTKDNFKQMLVDATVCSQKEEVAIDMLEMWLADIQLLSEAMVQTALVQFSSHPTKMDVAELTAFVKIESTVQALIPLVQAVIDD